jgi:ferrous iron transport protein A
MTLLNVQKGSIVKILALKGGAALAERLRALGFFPGSHVRLIKTAPFRGPLMIEEVTTGSRIMIGRGTAKKIEVSAGEPS